MCTEQNILKHHVWLGSLYVLGKWIGPFNYDSEWIVLKSNSVSKLESSSSISVDSQLNWSHRYVTKSPKTDFKLSNTSSMQHAGKQQDGYLAQQLCFSK
jgi:hypothetical protein